MVVFAGTISADKAANTSAPVGGQPHRHAISLKNELVLSELIPLNE